MIGIEVVVVPHFHSDLELTEITVECDADMNRVVHPGIVRDHETGMETNSKVTMNLFSNLFFLVVVIVLLAVRTSKARETRDKQTDADASDALHTPSEAGFFNLWMIV